MSARNLKLELSKKNGEVDKSNGVEVDWACLPTKLIFYQIRKSGGTKSRQWVAPIARPHG